MFYSHFLNLFLGSENMLSLKKILVLITISFFLSGCTSIKPVHQLDPNAVTLIQELDAHLIVDQDEIYADIKGSNSAAAAGGGLLFALIDIMVESSQTNTAESSIVPVRNHLIDYDYASVLHEKINSEISNISNFKVNKVNLERATNQNILSEKYNESGASAILFLTASYKLSPEFDSVQTIVEAYMFPINDALKVYREIGDSNESFVDMKDNIYHNTFLAHETLSNSGSKEKNISDINNDPEKVKVALEANAVFIASQIKIDLEK